MPRPAPTTVLFDLDGTLVDTVDLIVASYQHAFQVVLGRTPSAAEARAWIGRPLLPVLLEQSPEHGVELDRVYREWNLANTARLIRPYAGVREVVDALRALDVGLAVVTSKRRQAAGLALRSVGLESVEILAALEDTDRHKPLPDPLLHAAERLGVATEDCAYVGDAVVDIEAARAASMTAIAVTWGAGLPGALRAAAPDALVHTPSELLGALRGDPPPAAVGVSTGVERG